MIFSKKLKVWVLAPLVKSDDYNVNYYYDFTQSIAEYTAVFKQLELDWEWQFVTIDNYKNIIDIINFNCTLNNEEPLFFNLCDGDEQNEAPGISVVKYLNELNLQYTGADEYFYHITTSKANMKDAFDEFKVPTPDWIFIEKIDEIDESIFLKLGSPLIVKPAVSAGSMGISKKSVVTTFEELNTQITSIINGYRGWNLNAGGIIIEKFIEGPEFTVLITGDSDKPDLIHIYTPVERVFHSSLPEKEKLLSFDRLWEIYENETPMPNGENFYEYQLPDINLIDAIKEISLKAYKACNGKSYTRVDLRLDRKTNNLFVLETNAQCGLSEDEDYTSIGAILKFSNTSFTELVKEIIVNSMK